MVATTATLARLAVAALPHTLAVLFPPRVVELERRDAVMVDGSAVDRVRNPLDAIFIFRIHFANRMRFVRLALVNHVRVNQVQGALSLAGLH